MIQFPKPYADAVARLRVPSGFLIVLVFAWLSRPSAASIWVGLPFSLLGLLLRGWAAGCLDKNRRLAKDGEVHQRAVARPCKNHLRGLNGCAEGGRIQI